jgi:hypothetical protein
MEGRRDAGYATCRAALRWGAARWCWRGSTAPTRGGRHCAPPPTRRCRPGYGSWRCTYDGRRDRSSSWPGRPIRSPNSGGTNWSWRLGCSARSCSLSCRSNGSTPLWTGIRLRRCGRSRISGRLGLFMSGRGFVRGGRLGCIGVRRLSFPGGRLVRFGWFGFRTFRLFECLGFVPVISGAAVCFPAVLRPGWAGSLPTSLGAGP